MSTHIIEGGTLDARPTPVGAPQVFTITGDAGADAAVVILTNEQITQWHNALSQAKLRTIPGHNTATCLRCGAPTRLLSMAGNCDTCHRHNGPDEAA